MSNIENSPKWPENFCGTTRLFPLPNLVLFPHVIQPLHIFEPRYCEMLQEALATDMLIGMAQLEPGWETELHASPKIARTVCVGKIVSHTSTDEGRYNVMLVGLRRATIQKELESESPFRIAKVDVHEDVYPGEGAPSRGPMMDQLQELFAHFIPEGLASQESYQQLVGKQLPLGILTDTIAYALDLPLTIKQQLLAESNVDVRCRLLVRCLESKIESAPDSATSPLADGFPPPFSNN